MATQTPWGLSQDKTKYTTGITFYSTSRHGGFKVSRKLNQTIPSQFRKESGWYEEDCEAYIVVFFFPNLFSGEEVTTAKNALRTWFWKAYENFFGEEIPKGLSLTKDRDVLETSGQYLVVSALNQNEGVVKVCARINGHKGNQDSEVWMLMRSEEYKQIGESGFVVDPTEYQTAEPGF